MIKFVVALLLLLSFSCVAKPRLKIELQNTLQEVEAAMIAMIPLMDSLFPYSNAEENVFLGFHISDDGEVLLGDSIALGNYEELGIRTIPGFSNLSRNGQNQFEKNFELLYRNNIRGILLGIDTQFDYAPIGAYDRTDFYCSLILQMETGRIEDEIDRVGNLILVCRDLHRILDEGL